MTIPFHNRVVNLGLLQYVFLSEEARKREVCFAISLATCRRQSISVCLAGRSVHSFLNKCARLSMDKLSKHSLICPFQHMYTRTQ